MKLFGISAVILSIAALAMAGHSLLGPMSYHSCIERATEAQTKLAAVKIIKSCDEMFVVEGD